MLNLDKAYRVTLTTTKKTKYVQYIEAENMDSAINKALKTFSARLMQFEAGSEAQKACNLTKLNDKLRFGFKGGWTTLECKGLTIYEALEKAKHCFNDIQDITEIETAPQYRF